MKVGATSAKQRGPRTLTIFVRCFSFVRPYWRLAAASYVFFLATSGLSLVIPQLIRWIIDRGIKAGEASLAAACAALLGVAMLRGALTFFQGRWTEMVSQGVACNVRNRIHQKLSALSFSFHDKSVQGDILSRSIQDVERVRFLTGRALQRTVEGVVLLAGTAIILLVMDLRLALLALISAPFVVVIAFSFGRRFRPLSLRIQQQLGALTARIEQNLRGMRVVKAFAQENAEIAVFDLENTRWFEISRRAARIRATHIPVIETLANIGIIFVIWFGGRQVINGQLTLGQMVAFSAYLSQLALPIRRLGVTIAVLVQASSAGERILELLDERSEVVESPHARPLRVARGAVVFENVCFSYYRDSPVLSDICFAVEAGQRVAVLGTTGSGKSTVVKLIPRFYDPTSGRIRIDGTDIREVTLQSLRAQIGIVLQDSPLFSTTIRENIAFGIPRATQEQIVRAAESAQAHQFISELPEGYDTPVGEMGRTLSGGQKQRIAIARALLCDPRILILDDATSSVDTETEWLIQTALENLMRGRTAFVIAQRMGTVRQADLILVLDNGRIEATGTHERLIRSSGIYADLYNHYLQPPASSSPALAPEPQAEEGGAAR
jgi:ATP-binding cassette subfamily B multidrug efflux pump